MIDKALMQKLPDRSDELRSVIDLLYSFRQSLVFLKYKHEFIQSDEELERIATEMNFGRFDKTDLLRHNAFLESTLINIRAIDEFFKPKGTRQNLAADIRFESLFKKKPSSKHLDKEDVISISQLFAHITANRNVDRVPKQGFDLVKLTENTTAKFSEILTELSLSPVKEELDGNSELIWAIEALKD
jgi:hypothetical protein